MASSDMAKAFFILVPIALVRGRGSKRYPEDNYMYGSHCRPWPGSTVVYPTWPLVGLASHLEEGATRGAQLIWKRHSPWRNFCRVVLLLLQNIMLPRKNDGVATLEIWPSWNCFAHTQAFPHVRKRASCQKKASPCKDKVGKGSERLNERVCSKINNGSQAGRYSTCMV